MSAHLSERTACDSLVVRTQFGEQSATLDTCKTPKLAVRSVCLPLCGSRAFTVTVAESAGNDKVSSVKIGKCRSPAFAQNKDAVLVIFKMTRIFNGSHLYHVLNNLIVNLDPQMLDRYVFHCWGCEVHFSEFFDSVLGINSKMVTTGCYINYIFLGEHYTTYNVDLHDEEKAKRWQDWAFIFKSTWCPKLIHEADRHFTILDRQGAQNGRNMHDCRLESSRSISVRPTLNNTRQSSKIFCNTRVLVSAEGNGLTNMLLMPRGSTVVVIWQSNRPVSTLEVIYGNMAKLLGMNMVPIPVESDGDLNVNCSAYLNELFRVLF